MVRLYLDDLEAIEQVLRELNPDGDLTLTSPNWTAESVDELRQHEASVGPFTKFEIAQHKGGYFTLRAKGFEADLYAADVHDLRVRGAFEGIEGVLLRARPSPLIRHLAGTAGHAIFQTIATLGLLLGAVAAGRDQFIIAVLWVLVALGGGLGLWSSWRTGHRRGTLIYLEPKAQRPNFLRRNRDQIGLLAIGAILGAIFTTIVTLLVPS